MAEVNCIRANAGHWRNPLNPYLIEQQSGFCEKRDIRRDRFVQKNRLISITNPGNSATPGAFRLFFQPAFFYSAQERLHWSFADRDASAG